jgi:hypothetical protein
MISRTSGKVSRSSSLFRLLSIAAVTALSAVLMAVPAQADDPELSFSPAQPAFELGGPSPALVITSDNISMPVKVKRLYIKMDSGSRAPWSVNSACTSTPSSSLADCAVVSVKVTDNGVMTDLTSGVQVAQTNGQIEIIFNTELQYVSQAPNTRTIEVSLAQGAFTVNQASTSLSVNMQFQSAPVQQGGGTMSSIHTKSFGDYAGVSFNGGAGSVGTMNGILKPTTSLLPSNSFTKSGFNFAGWSCTEGGEVNYADQAVMFNIRSCPTLYAVWTAVGSSAPAATTAPASTAPAAKLATTGTSLSALAPALALFLGWMLVMYSRSLRASRARHLKI